MSVWLTARDLAKTAPAERAALPSPIPTQVVSNGEYLPAPRTAAQRAVAATIADLADRHGRALGLTRRQFLRTASGMAAAFLAMNRVYGALFAVDPAEASNHEAAGARRAALAKEFVLDAQLHFVRDDFTWPGILALGEFAKRWNPVLAAEGVTMHRYKFENFVKEVFLDSDTAIGILSAAPADDPTNSILTNEQMARARTVVNGLAGARRLLCHAVFRPGQPGWLDDLERAVELRPDSWKGYTVGDPLASSQWPWRLDDEQLVYPAYARMAKAGVRTICIHKGLVPPDYEKSLKHWRYAMVDDLARAARDWPQLTFVIYHSALKPLMTPPDESLAQFERSGRMDWVSDLAEIPARHGLTNVYAELGTAFATAAVTHPRHAAALLGILVKGMGSDHVVWGTDSVWYGSPQWQIEAFRRIEIPPDMQERHGFAPLGAPDGAVKRAILGRNAARLYGLEREATADPGLFAEDGLGRMKREYIAGGGAPSNAAYGYVRVRALMAAELDGKTAVLTGAASGIGRATALAFARAGARIVVADVDVAGGEETASAARALGATAHFVRCDVARMDEVAALIARTVALLGRLDCAFNNAGIEGTLAPIADCPEEAAARVIDVNLMGVWRCLHAELPVMAAQGGGAVVNTASVAGLVGAGGLAPYVASKHGVLGLTKAAALEYAKSGVRVNAVCPGVIQTPMVDRLAAASPGVIEALLAVKPMGRLGTPDEVAAAVVWLCSDAASFTTGHSLVVDGGYVVP